MIANIERQFLKKEDLKEIHYYFGSHRPDNKMIYHLRIQLVLGLGLGTIVLGYHFFERVLPGFSEPITNFDPIRSIPYIIVLGAIIYLSILKSKLITKYNEFITNSPGITVDTTDVDYGVGHGH